MKPTSLLLLLSFFTLTLVAEDLPFLGEWTVDMDRTLEEGKKSPKYDPAEADRMPAMIKRMMETMRIRITPEEMIYLRGSREMAMPYTLSEQNGDQFILTIPAGEKSVTVTLTLIEGTYLNLKSSASDDMDFYVWKPAEDAAE